MTAQSGAPTLTTLEIPVAGMDCAGCTKSVQQALSALPGVTSADVLLSSEKAIVRLDPAQVDRGPNPCRRACRLSRPGVAG